jgi:hypothetical protein
MRIQILHVRWRSLRVVPEVLLKVILQVRQVFQANLVHLG